ncbi:alpha/beta hydrolase family protein [Aspergillus homomorphus CBS 101889]|uniref:Alpha/beta-hydrolase n=1 Tax=Aspergillus homomorphus (strain CBS 101889) TaxID=1450537 RepID=A0A395HVF8_ASPHC|nr:alpha/beta-hydrolase [Aspergillus homomorphus CBS 101889]RAL10204.1 alpha/beta-hydrolase [Aspergillus homomorphus CBS 101889]
MRGQWVFPRAQCSLSPRTPKPVATLQPRTSYQGYHRLRTQRATTIHTSTPSPRINQPQFPFKQYPTIPNLRRQTRTLITTTLPPILIPPTIFLGLLLALWTWKCLWIVLLQDKLLYLAWLPPLSRSEKIEDYERECRPVQWTETQIRSLDGTKLSVCEGRLPRPADRPRPRPRRKVVICYFQGNGGSTPLRLPLLSQTLRALSRAPAGLEGKVETEYIVVALSYRGYWTSSGRASQRGIERDAQAFLGWVRSTYVARVSSTEGRDVDGEVKVVLWGHSLGAAVASTALATHLSVGGAGEVAAGENAGTGQEGESAAALPITGLVLEAPSSSVKEMLISLYPQRWLPYRYLWPFLWNHWDGVAALRRMGAWRDEAVRKGAVGDAASMHQESGKKRSLPPILLLTAEKDEVIPPEAAAQLEEEAKKLGIEMVRTDVPGAMHTEAPVRPVGRKALVEFIWARS